MILAKRPRSDTENLKCPLQLCTRRRTPNGTGSQAAHTHRIPHPRHRQNLQPLQFPTFRPFSFIKNTTKKRKQSYTSTFHKMSKKCTPNAHPPIHTYTLSSFPCLNARPILQLYITISYHKYTRKAEQIIYTKMRGNNIHENEIERIFVFLILQFSASPKQSLSKICGLGHTLRRARSY